MAGRISAVSEAPRTAPPVRPGRVNAGRERAARREPLRHQPRQAGLGEANARAEERREAEHRPEVRGHRAQTPADDEQEQADRDGPPGPPAIDEPPPRPGSAQSPIMAIGRANSTPARA